MDTKKIIKKTGKYPFTIDAYLTDFKGRAMLPMMGGFMLQAAAKHAEERGFGYSSMTSKKRAWVLSRLAVDMFEYPKNDTVLTVKTWIFNVNRLFTERHFAFEDSAGNVMGFARTTWASIDMETRKPVNLLELYGLTDYVREEQEAPIEGLTKIPILKDSFETASEFTVKYSDIDINRHMNSMKYIEHFIDVFDINLFKDKEIRRIEINYIAEAGYGAHLKILQRKENDSCILEMKNGETNICSARVKWIIYSAKTTKTRG
ncbi:MAG: hypothetical protein LBT29_00040 [Flavobacteriaceae bacterium]|jgi:acyl-ACP thioesterase|nr:hypothetical protein [Flavobacteriaceae bacterium]